MGIETLDRVAREIRTATRLKEETQEALPQLWEGTVGFIESKGLSEIQISQDSGWDVKTVNTIIPYKGKDIKISLSFSIRPDDDTNDRCKKVKFTINGKDILSLHLRRINDSEHIRSIDYTKDGWHGANPKSVLNMVELVNFLKAQPKKKIKN